MDWRGEERRGKEKDGRRCNGGSGGGGGGDGDGDGGGGEEGDLEHCSRVSRRDEEGREEARGKEETR
ncbi:hypothetical protein HZH68_000601 [Vespula germanica]|uniref:Uncharacterized protein n=1 Tax=Vespula germanica TaxID=30212 RepID=A0A834U656_VESGE|nr:hypothetical protein HZH68_000601 [Vespula germanica]